MRCEQVLLPDGSGYTDVWVDGKYSRFPWLCSLVEAVALVQQHRRRVKQ